MEKEAEVAVEKVVVAENELEVEKEVEAVAHRITTMDPARIVQRQRK